MSDNKRSKRWPRTLLTQDYAVFTSVNPSFDFSFIYPKAWEVEEVEGKEFHEVFLLSPKPRPTSYGAPVAVHVRTDQPHSIADLIKIHLERAQHMSQFRRIFQTNGMLAGHEAVEFATSYVMSLPLNVIEPVRTQIIERWIVFRRGAKFYEIVYRASQEDYATFLDVYRQIVKTFEFQEERDRASQEFYPLVTPTVAVHETPAD